MQQEKKEGHMPMAEELKVVVERQVELGAVILRGEARERGEGTRSRAK